MHTTIIRGVGIAAPHRFDEGRDDVVVLFAVLVVEGDVLLEAVGDVPVGDRHLAVGGPDDDFEDVEQLARVAAREAEQRPIWEVASSHLARRAFVGNLYKQVKDPNLVGALSGHKEGSRAFARYRDIDEDMKNELVKMLE